MEQKGEVSSELAHDERTDVVAALRGLGEKIDGHIERQNEGLMRLGYSTATLNSAASESLTAVKMLGDERKKLAEIIGRPVCSQAAEDLHGRGVGRRFGDRPGRFHGGGLALRLV